MNLIEESFQKKEEKKQGMEKSQAGVPGISAFVYDYSPDCGACAVF